MLNASSFVVPFAHKDAKAIDALSPVERAAYMQDANVAMQVAAKNGSALIGHIFYTASVDYGTDSFARALCIETVPAEFRSYAESFWAPFRRAHAEGKAERALTHFSSLAKDYPAKPKAPKPTAADKLADAVETIDALASAVATERVTPDPDMAAALAAVTAERDALRLRVEALEAENAQLRIGRKQRAPRPVVPSAEQSAMAAAMVRAGLVEAVLTH